MIEDLIEDRIKKQVIENYLESLSVFLKYTFNHHAKIDDDNSSSHGLKFILGNPLRTSSCASTTLNSKIHIIFPQYKFPFFLIDTVKTAIISSNFNDSKLTTEQLSNCLNVLDDAQDKSVLYPLTSEKVMDKKCP